MVLGYTRRNQRGAWVSAPASESTATLAACCLSDPSLSALLGLQSVIFLSRLIRAILYLSLPGFLLSPTACLERLCFSPPDFCLQNSQIPLPALESQPGLSCTPMIKTPRERNTENFFTVAITWLSFYLLRLTATFAQQLSSW